MSLPIPTVNQNAGAVSQIAPIGPGFNNSVAYWLEEQTSNLRKSWEVFAPRLKRVEWKRNSGYQMRAVGIEDSPVLSQDFTPALLKDNMPKMDVVLGRERVSSADLYDHLFTSPPFSFVPEFFDFLPNAARHRQIIERAMVRRTEQFYRTRIFAAAPYVYLAGHGLVATDTGFDSSGKPKKYAAIAANIDKVTQPLTYDNLFKAVMEWSEAVSPEPRVDMSSEKSAITGHFDLILSTADWGQLGNDIYVKANRRPEADNILFEPLKGSPFGMLKPVFEYLQLRFSVSSGGEFTLPAPQQTLVSTGDPTEGMAVPNPDYANAPYRVLFLFGAPPGVAVVPGAPPEIFTGNGVPDNFKMLDWNGRPKLATESIMQALDSSNNVVTVSNYLGRMVRWVANGVYGYRPDFPRNVLPIIVQKPIFGKTV